ncbi:MAG: hypothetical protein QOC95_2691 [Thermoleophilaceae bacterium]|jgi:chromosome segregation ATPase|nr:hypothetical protein [Thermoleophilaceae bacterium]
MAEEEDMAARLEATKRKLAEMSTAMDETKRRQDEIQSRQAALLDQLERLNRAMDPEEPG